MNFSLYELFIALIIGYCLFLILTIHFTSQQNKDANKFLKYLFVIYLVFLVKRLAWEKFGMDYVLKYSFISNTLFFLIGPFIFTYVRRLLFQKSNRFQLSAVHYFLPLLYLAYSIVHVFLYPYVSHSELYWNTFGFTWETLAILSVSFYLVKANQLLSNFHNIEIQEFSFRQEIAVYLRIILACIAVTVVIWFAEIIYRMLSETSLHRALFFEINRLIYGVLFLIVSIYFLKQPKIFKVNVEDSELKQIYSRLDEKQIEKLKHKVDFFLNDAKGYHNADLSLSLLAEQISTSTNILSWLLNNVYQKSFYELINEYRINEFIERIKNKEHEQFTLLSIAYGVGFKSKATFYRSFHKVKGTTPSKFLKDSMDSSH